MTFPIFWNTIVHSVQTLGYLWLIGLLVIDFILWRIHPALGTIGIILIIAYLLGMF